MSILTRVSDAVRSAAYSAQETIDAISNSVATPEGESYFSTNEYRYFASRQWTEGASLGQRVMGETLGVTVAAGAAAGTFLAAKALVVLGVFEGVSAGVAGVANFVATNAPIAATAVSGILARSLGLGALALGLAKCGGGDDGTPNQVVQTPDGGASNPITQDQWCDGVRSLTVAPIANASSLVSAFPGISDHLRNLPRNMNVIGVAPQQSGSQSPYAYVLVDNTRPFSQREATEVETYVLRYERNSAGNYVPSDSRRNDPLGSLRNVSFLSSSEADSITYVPAASFSSASQADGAAQVNLFHPAFTARDAIILRYTNDQMSLFPYGENNPVGGADVCAAYGQSITPVNIDASVSGDAVANDAANDTGIDASVREAGVDASVDAPRDVSGDRLDGGVDATRNDAPADVRTDVRDSGVDVRTDVRDASTDVRDASTDIRG